MSLDLSKPKVTRTKRTDHILLFKQKYSGNLHQDPATFNKAFANVVRGMADSLDKIKNQWADPQVTVWTHENGLISAELPMSGPIRKKKR